MIDFSSNFFWLFYSQIRLISNESNRNVIVIEVRKNKSNRSETNQKRPFPIGILNAGENNPILLTVLSPAN